MVTEILAIYQNNELTSLKNKEVEPVEPVQMNIYQSNTYRKDLSRLWDHAWPYGRFVGMQGNLRRKTLHRTNQGSDFLGGTFSNRDNARAPVQFRRESQSQHLEIWFFLKNRAIHVPINSTSVIRPVKWNQLSFSSIEINTPLLVPVHSVSYIRF